MQILPVLDLLDGVVVRGVAGRRNEYRPVESVLAPGAEAVAVARAFRDQLGLNGLYVADLDAILKRSPNVELYRRLIGEGFHLSVDAGLRSCADAASVAEAGVGALVAGLETIGGPAELADLCAHYGAARIVFSLDMKEGRPLANRDAWDTDDPRAIAAKAARVGVRRFIVLDLSSVGVSQGVSTLDMCEWIRRKVGDAEVITGGGVRDIDDLLRLKEAGIDGALVASAFHSGAIGRAELQRIAGQ